MQVYEKQCIYIKQQSQSRLCESKIFYERCGNLPYIPFELCHEQTASCFLNKINERTSCTVSKLHVFSSKGTSRQRSGKGAIRKRFPLQKPRWEKTKLTIRYLYHETIVSRMGSYFPNRWPLSYLNLTKNMKTYIRRQQHKKF